MNNPENKCAILQRGNRNELKDKCDEMQKDIDKLLAKIQSLEQQRDQYKKQADEFKSAAEAGDSGEQIANLKLENGNLRSLIARSLNCPAEKLNTSLRTERSRAKAMEAQLGDYRLIQVLNNADIVLFHRQTLATAGESGKLVMMASRVEQLREQLREAEERYSGIHRRLVAGGKDKSVKSYEVRL